ncbi:uncharacterized protein PHACADRAFT_204864 [Phanerochaete carnosa HHB-10118-sp]|uniref:Uncharacterized protein n=1 Tax=Phanerochaete carnosa (strain HHB-10118-sp) TaxID=650164 RepID=K5VF90_PHACS|nr:uncharacterized protein PHACADRAFT_204864 [Phanerochaete carnosa HHB-10118-sp]EKM61696.1 hypothetical protein PHACADRAFT_204864 [Phanerochaete carnosa HHB-10118-sp]
MTPAYVYPDPADIGRNVTVSTLALDDYITAVSLLFDDSHAISGWTTNLTLEIVLLGVFTPLAMLAAYLLARKGLKSIAVVYQMLACIIITSGLIEIISLTRVITLAALTKSYCERMLQYENTPMPRPMLQPPANPTMGSLIAALIPSNHRDLCRVVVSSP